MIARIEARVAVTGLSMSRKAPPPRGWSATAVAARARRSKASPWNMAGDQLRSARRDSWNAAKLFARDHLRNNRWTGPKAGLESVAEVKDIYQQAIRRLR